MTRVKIHRNSKRPLYLNEIACQCQLCNGYFAEEELEEEICRPCRIRIEKSDNDIYVGFRSDDLDEDDPIRNFCSDHNFDDLAIEDGE